MNQFRRDRIVKLAFGLDYFAQRQMSPADMQQVDTVLDAQGIPRYAPTPPPPPAAPGFFGSLRGAPPPLVQSQPVAFMDRARAFGTQHRKKLLIGGGVAAAAGLGAMFLRRRSNEAQVIEPEMPNQTGF